MISQIPSSKPFSPTLFLVSIASMLGLVLGPTACDSEPEAESTDNGNSAGPACTSDAECGEDGTCGLDGTCQFACTSDADCGFSEFCTGRGECKASCTVCGGLCATTADCPNAQYCSSSGTCQRECIPNSSDTSCGNDECSDDGRCVATSDIMVPTGSGGSMGTGGMSNQDCIDVEVDFTPEIPSVVLLIDQSASMNENNFGDSVDAAMEAGEYTPWDCDDYDYRWNVVRNVLLHPDTGVVAPLENDVRFGMALYSSSRGFSGGTCPALTEVAVDFGTHGAMLDNFECSDLVGDTPTRESLTATAEALAAAALDGPKVIVLATDGEPDNCTCYNWDEEAGADCADSAVVERDGVEMTPSDAEQYDVVLEAARINQELGITVEVINVSNPQNTDLATHLDNVAVQGGATSGASIDGFSPGALAEAFQTIIDGARSCAIDLDGEITAGREATGTVSLDGTDLVYDDPNGWVVNSPTQIELVGTACETIKSGDHDIDVTFPCGSFVVR